MTEARRPSNSRRSAPLRGGGTQPDSAAGHGMVSGSSQPTPVAPTAPAAVPIRPPRPRGGRAPPTPPGMSVHPLDAHRSTQATTCSSALAYAEGGGYPSAFDLSMSSRDKEHSAASKQSSAGSATNSMASASPALGLSSAGGSTSSTRAPSPATTGTPTPGSAPASARRSPRPLGLAGSASDHQRPPSVPGQLGAPASWRFKPVAVEQQLREQGLGAGHLKGRRANLARIREIQGKVAIES